MKYSKIPLLSPKSIHMFSSLEYIEYIKSLRKKSESKTLSKNVEGINISNSKRLIIKITREHKLFTEEEIDLLVAEFSLEKRILLEALMKRKVEVQDATGFRINSPVPKVRKARDAKHKPATRRKKKDPHQQLEPGHDPVLPEESIL